jgi:hypothetical protein
MISISSELANSDVVKRFVKECPERFTDVIEVAINKAAARIRYLVKKEVPNKWGVNKDEMKDFKLRRALRKQGELTATAILRGRNVPLFRFDNVSPRTPMTGKTSGGVTVLIAGNSQNFKRAFVGMMPSGHKGIFERTGKKTASGAEQITELTTVSVPGMAASEKTGIPDKIAPMVQEEFNNQFIREAAAWLNVLGAK